MAYYSLCDGCLRLGNSEKKKHFPKGGGGTPLGVFLNLFFFFFCFFFLLHKFGVGHWNYTLFPKLGTIKSCFPSYSLMIASCCDFTSQHSSYWPSNPNHGAFWQANSLSSWLPRRVLLITLFALWIVFWIPTVDSYLKNSHSNFFLEKFFLRLLKAVW